MTQPIPVRRAACLLDAALAAAERGWHVHPLRAGGKAPALHGEAACPGTGDCTGGHAKWEQRATLDTDRIRAAWSAGAFNVGIATGPSGLVVVDLDAPKTNSESDAPCGAATFRALCERAGQPVPATYTVRTAGGGWHLYFTAPPGVRLGNTVGKLGALIDTRAHGGYVVAPGSTTPAGTYAVTGDTDPVPLPEWLCRLLTPRQSSRALTATPSRSRAAGYAAAALRAETANVAEAGEGVRNWTLTRAARALGRFIASGDLSRTEVEDALRAGGEAAGLSVRYCQGVITSALNWSIAHNPSGRAS